MLIPEYNAKSAPIPQLTTFTHMEEYEKLRKATTDKLILILVAAEWDDASKLLLQMVAEMPSNFRSIKFAVVDADQVPSLVDHFQIDAVPSVVLMHPHK